jgi:hypothetical protein
MPEAHSESNKKKLVRTIITFKGEKTADIQKEY